MKDCDKCKEATGFYLGVTCPECNQPFRQTNNMSPTQAITNKIQSEIKPAMKAQGITPYRIAKMTGIGYQTVNEFLKGNCNAIALDKYFGICLALGVCGDTDIVSESDTLSNPLVKMQVDSIIESRDKLDKSERTAVALLKNLWEHPELRKDHLYTMQIETYLATER